MQIIKKLNHIFQIVVISDDSSYETGAKIATAGVYYTVSKPIDDRMTKDPTASAKRRVRKTKG